jgi:pimeloyl-ACP methyl ester carboxylesterase
MVTGSIAFKSSLVHYSHWGFGPEIWLCIPGYGNTSESFDFLTVQIPADQYTLIAVDLPFHGQTQWKEGLRLSVADLIEIIEGILTNLGRQKENFKLIGYSLGGRIALSLVEKIPERISKLVLLAPDGLNISYWYWLATQNPFGEQLLRWTTVHPAWVLSLLKIGKSCRIIGLEYYHYALYFIQDKAAREDLYHRWITLKKFKPDLESVKSSIAEHKLRVELLLSQDDPLIRPVEGEKFKSGIESFCSLTLIAGGHQLLQEKNAGIILSLLKN